MENWNGTKGEWKMLNNYDEMDTPRFSITSNEGVLAHCYNFQICCGVQERTKANAELIVDAGTTINKCGLLPCELLDQRNDLLEAFKYEVSLLQDVRAKEGWTKEEAARHSRLLKAITKTESKT